MLATINNHEWNIAEVEWQDHKLLGSDNIFSYGRTYYAELTIYLSKILPASVKTEVLRHELTHAFLYSTQVSRQDNFTYEEVCDLVGTYGKQIADIADKYMKGN